MYGRGSKMPELCRFYGIIIRMYFADHGPPHFHADVDDRLVWDVIKTNLPTLGREVDVLLKESADD